MFVKGMHESGNGVYISTGGWDKWDTLELVKRKSKEKQMKDLKKSKFMVYGTGCDNKTGWYDTKKEAQEKAQELAYD
jgi:hypothetical protein